MFLLRKLIKLLVAGIMTLGIVLSFTACRSDEKKPMIGDFPDPGEESLDHTYRC